LERGFILTWQFFWQLGKTQDLPSENCQTLGDALNYFKRNALNDELKSFG